MADVITRFKLETTQYDSKLRDASKSLVEYTRKATQAGNEFGKFTQKNVEAARALGNITPSATNAKDKVKELVGAFNDAARAYNALTKEQQQSDFGRAMAGSMQQLQVKIREAKQELYGLDGAMKKVGGSGLFSGIGDKMSGALQVFAGNIMTKAAGAVANLGSEMYGMVQQGIELAKQGEGIRNAFERLGRGDILDGLREATHGTVTDIELMKAAVKFNDFKLPLDELGTMLAFAQQKAKDTGQSVDYMVDSIVTGLGRKSLMILDNLGLSATEVKERMAETGDMTKAVGVIIRDQMAKAGDYVETAADRAAQANVSLQNKMEELGRKFAPLQEASNNFWTSMKIGILDVVGGPLARLLNGLTEAGRLKNALNDINGDGGETRSSRRLRILREYSGSQTGVTKQTIYNRQIARYAAEEEKEWRKVNELTRKRQDILKELGNINPWKDEKGVQANFLNAQANSLLSQINDAKDNAKAIQLSRQEYEKGAKQILQPIKQYVSPPTLTSPSGGGGKGGKAEIEAVIGSIDYQTKKVQELQKAWRAAADDDSREKIKKQIEEQQYVLDRMTGKEKFDPSKMKEIKGASLNVPEQVLRNPLEGLKTMKQSIQLELKTEAVKVDETTLHTLMKDAVQNGINGMDLQFNAIGEKIGKGIDVPDSVWEKIIEEYNDVRKQLGMEPITIDIKTGNMEEIGNDAKVVKGSFREAASAVGSLGSALSGLDDPGAKIAGTIGQAIANIAMGFASASAKEGAKGNVWYWIAATAAGLATMVSTISTIHSTTGYANGGIIDGKSYSGDNIAGLVDGRSLVGLNSQEIVLNHAQSYNLANSLEGGGLRGLNLSAMVTGEQIMLVANRYTMRSGQGEILTWK